MKGYGGRSDAKTRAGRNVPNVKGEGASRYERARAPWHRNPVTIALVGNTEQPVDAGAVARAVSWMGAGHVVSQILWFGSLLILATLVPPSSFGTFTAGWVIVAVALLFMESGTRGSLIVSRELTVRRIRGATLRITALGVALAGTLALLSGPIVSTVAISGDASVLRALSATVALTALAVVPLALLQRQLQFRRHTIAILAATIPASVLAIAAGLLGAGVWALVVRQTAYTALVCGFAWFAVRDLVADLAATTEPTKPALTRRGGAGWFLALAVGSFVAFNVDYIVVGNSTDAGQLGLYSLAFMLAFAPLTNVSWKLGTVLFPAAAATSDVGATGRRTLRALRLLALMLLPLLSPAVALAPWLLPWALGEAWEDMVQPFQILVVAGIGQALVNILGESLSGTGHIALHAWLQALMCVLLVPALVVLVELDGIRGAALAHLIVLVPVAALYWTLGGRRLGLRPLAVGSALRDVALPVAVQAGTTLITAVALAQAGVEDAVAAAVGAFAGALALVAGLRASSWSPWDEARGLFYAALGRTSA